MKKLLLILICLFSYSPSHSKWEEIGSTEDKDIYIDKDRIRVKGDSVFYWELMNFSKPIGLLKEQSVMTYIQGHCDQFKIKVLERVVCKEPMGKSDCMEHSSSRDYREWSYPIPNSIREFSLNFVCKGR